MIILHSTESQGDESAFYPLLFFSKWHAHMAVVTNGSLFCSLTSRIYLSHIRNSDVLNVRSDRRLSPWDGFFRVAISAVSRPRCTAKTAETCSRHIAHVPLLVKVGYVCVSLLHVASSSPLCRRMPYVTFCTRNCSCQGVGCRLTSYMCLKFKSAYRHDLRLRLCNSLLLQEYGCNRAEYWSCSVNESRESQQGVSCQEKVSNQS